MHGEPSVTGIIHDLAREVCSLTSAIREHNETLRVLHRIETKLESIMANQKDLAADVRAATVQLQKISAESTKTLELVDALKAQLEEAEVDPELIAAVTELKAQAQALDDLTPDEIVTPPSDVPTP